MTLQRSICGPRVITSNHGPSVAVERCRQRQQAGR
jgi:hypothetical protein